jgi:hypothetical protein
VTIHLRFTAPLWAAIHADLDRPHQFAHERVAFVSCRPAALQVGLLLLAHDFHPVADNHYESGSGAGAMISGAAFSKALGLAHRSPLTILHVHRHEHEGAPRFSGYDVAQARQFVPDFWKVRPELPHGTLVLSHDSAYGLVWARRGTEPVVINRITVVGAPCVDIRHDPYR